MEKLYTSENGIVREFTAEEYAEEALKREHETSVFLPKQIRDKRSRLLAESDWTQVNDSPLSNEKKTEWSTYRQALRDITTQSGFPTDIVWPIQPE